MMFGVNGVPDKRPGNGGVNIGCSQWGKERAGPAKSGNWKVTCFFTHLNNGIIKLVYAGHYGKEFKSLVYPFF